MDRRKIEYNGKDNIRGISPLPEDTKDKGKHLTNRVTVSFLRCNLFQIVLQKQCKIIHLIQVAVGNWGFGSSSGMFYAHGVRAGDG